MNTSDAPNVDPDERATHGSQHGQPHTPHDSHTTAPPRTGTFDRFFAWLRGLGIVRGNDRWFAGVAGGIAAKAGIDPILVRGVFVVLAVLGGPGILLYLAAWVLLPDAQGRIHFEDLVRGRASAGVITVAIILGVVLVLPLVFWALRSVFFTPFSWDVWGIFPDWMQVVFTVLWWGFVVPGLVIWLISWFATGAGRRTDRESAQHTFAQQAQSWGQQAGEWGQRVGEQAGAWGEDIGRKAGEWGDRVGQQTSDWAQQVGRSEPPALNPRPSAAFVLISLGMGLFVGASVAGLSMVASFSPGTTLTLGLLAGVSILAVAMIVAGIRGTESGWIGFVAFCGVIALIFSPLTTVLPEQTEVVPFGNTRVVVEPTDSDRAVLTLFGNSTVDLQQLGQFAKPRSIEVWMIAGNVNVLLPDSAPTMVRVSLVAGNVRDERVGSDERRQGGVFMSRTISHHAAGLSPDEVIDVHIRMVAGNATVEGGSSVQADAGDRDQRESLTQEQAGQGRHDQERDALQREIDELTDRLEELENAR